MSNSNEFYLYGDTLIAAETAQAEDVQGELEAIETGLDKLLTETQQKFGGVWYQGTDSGSANAYAIAMTYTWTSYVEGRGVQFKAANANTGASTINVDTLGAKTITRTDGAALQAGDITAGAIVSLIYDGTNFQIVSAVQGMITEAVTAQTAAEAAQAAAETAQSAAEGAQTAAEAAQSAAETAETNAETAETNADLERQYAAEWANKAEDSPVSVAAGGDGSTTFSAKHFSEKARDFAGLPPLTGNAGASLLVNDSEDGVEWGEGSPIQLLATLSTQAAGKTPVTKDLPFEVTGPIRGSNSFVRVANDVFFTGIFNNLIYTSTDGETWVERTMPSSEDWFCFAWTGTNYVAVNKAGTDAAYSSDLVNWTGTTLTNTVTNCWYIASDGAGTVIVPAGATSANRSTDHGVTWSGVTFPNLFRSVYRVGSNFVGVPTSGGTTLYYSSTGDTGTWTLCTSPIVSHSYAYVVQWGDGTLCVADNGTGEQFITTDGITFTKLCDPPDAPNSDGFTTFCVIKVNGVYLAYSLSGDQAYGFWVSYDLSTWIKFDLPRVRDSFTLKSPVEGLITDSSEALLLGVMSYAGSTSHQVFKASITGLNIYEAD